MGKITSITDTTTLSNGVKMPWLGLGVWRMKEEGGETEKAVLCALETGYRSIDTASAYGNEEGVGAAVRASGIPRDQLFITTKLNNPDQGYESTLKVFEQSRKRLGMDYVDLYLIHWPVKGKYLDTWRAFEKLYKEGAVRAIGLSNFYEHHIKDILNICTVRPMVDQVELHPTMTLEPLRAYCREQQIQIEAWSPIMKGGLDYPVLKDIAARHGKTAAQVVLRWDLQSGIVTIPKSVHPERIAENCGVFDFELSDEEMKAIDGLNANRRIGPDPDNFNF